jgi:predicted O-linked N-acetylglucosamine transferase (SPINDLY family)
MSMGHGDQALALHRAGRLKEAIEAYELAIEETNEPPPILLHFAGMACFQNGRSKKAELYLGRAASAVPQRADFQFAHGSALASLGRHKAALAAYRRTVELNPSNASAWFNLGNEAQAAKEPQQAADAFQRALDLDPLMTQALANLADNLVTSQNFEKFAALLQRVHALGIWREHFTGVALIGVSAGSDMMAGDRGLPVLEALRDLMQRYPDDAEIVWVLGSLYLMRRDFAPAEECLERAIELDPGQAGAKRSLGVLLACRGEDDRARTLLADIKYEDPDAGALIKFINLMISLHDRSLAAMHAYDIAADVYPKHRMIFEMHFSWLLLCEDPEALPATVHILENWLEHDESAQQLVNLGATLQKMKHEGEAVRYFHRALELDKRSFHAWHNLSGVQLNQNRIAEAYESAKKAARLNPSSEDAAMNVALSAGKLGKIEESERALRRGLKYNPNSPELLNLMGNSKMRRGNMRSALGYFAKARKYVDVKQNSSLFAMQLMAVNYSAKVPAETVADMHFRWGDAIRASVAKQRKPAARPSEKKSRLKVGFMSGDYRNHSCAYFMKPLIDNLDRDRIDIHCYMTETGSDDQTLKFRRSAPHWREIVHLTDIDVVDRIREDGIDILMDLSGHTSGSRLMVFAMKAAPIQVTWLGYPNTTGLPTMDYRITDALADPIGMTEHLHREQLYRLPHFLCYEPPEYTPPVGPPPVRREGRITFGCFNNSNKITDEVVAAWCAIMHRVPGSSIYLKTSNLSDQLTLDAFRAKFSRNGIEAERVECFPSFPSKYDHLMTYGEVDLALDPFPYNGTTTTFESLWMGVPMIGLAGEVHAARVGHSILTGMGLGELVADSEAEYIDKAVALALDHERVADYRSRTRQMLRSSPLMDGKGFAASMETAYFDMWKHALAETRPIDLAG